MAEIKDFSDFLDEAEQQEAVPVKWKDHEWLLPRPSALQQLKVERAQMALYDLEMRRNHNPDLVLDDQEIEKYREAMAGSNYLDQMEILLGGGSDDESRATGRERIEEMLSTGLPLKTFQAMFRHVFGLPVGDNQGEAPAPNREARRQGAKSKNRSKSSGRSAATGA